MQTSTYSFDEEQTPDEQWISFRPGGMFLTSLRETLPGYQLVCAFGSGIAMPSWPVRPGQRFSGEGDCGDGVTNRISGQVVRTANTRVPAGTFSTVEIEWIQNITLEGTPFTITTRDMLAPSLRLPVESWRRYDATGMQFTLHARLEARP